MRTKVIAMYLPQFHSIPENDKWWGEGYTDWVAVKKSKPLYKGHEQPRVPLDGYYNLTDKDTIKKQAEQARKGGIYGFGIYHYWFSSDMQLLQKPAEIIRDNSDIDINYFFTWDNVNWKRTWSNVRFSNSWAPLYDKEKKGPEVLAELIYGGEDEWEKHFEYLLPFFEDERYIKTEGKPLFGIFNQNNQPEILHPMFTYWNKLAKEHGFAGIQILGKTNASKIRVADWQFDYEPMTHGWTGKNNLRKALLRIKDNCRLKLGLMKKYEYKEVWKRILGDISRNPDYLPGAFVRYDDTPRRGEKGTVVTGESPELFEKYMSSLLKISNKLDKEFVFLTAWNEWGEGAYMEPDTRNGYAYLEALKKAVDCADKENV